MAKKVSEMNISGYVKQAYVGSTDLKKRDSGISNDKSGVKSSVDSFTLSDNAKEVVKSSGTDSAKIEKIKKSVESGVYKVDISKLADKIIESGVERY